MKNLSSSFNAIYLAFVLAIMTHIGIARADDQSKWQINLQNNTVEAFTLGSNETSLGLFCAMNECFFYVHQPIPCLNGSQIPGLLSSDTLATSITLRCAQFGNQLFGILDPFANLLKVMQESKRITLALPLSNGAVGVLEFSLVGAKDATAFTLLHAAKLEKVQPNQGMPKTPGVTPLKQIEL